MGATCLICGAPSCGKAVTYGDGHLIRCPACGFGQMAEPISDEELHSVYMKDTYFSGGESLSLGYDDYLGDEKNIKRTFTRRLNRLSAYLPKNAKALDVGCAYGFFMDVAKEEGFGAWGIDVAQSAVNVATRRHGSNVINSTLDAVAFKPETFNLVTLWDVIEHVSNPIALLKRSAELLGAGGIIALTTPDIGSVPARLTGRRWMGFKPREHVCFFTRESLALALRNNGFEIVTMRHEGKYVSLSVFVDRVGHYLPFIKPITSYLAGWHVLKEASVYVNPLDILLVIARKLP